MEKLGKIGWEQGKACTPGLKVCYLSKLCLLSFPANQILSQCKMVNYKYLISLICRAILATTMSTHGICLRVPTN